jgi:hypothetical protein
VRIPQKSNWFKMCYKHFESFTVGRLVKNSWTYHYCTSVIHTTVTTSQITISYFMSAKEMSVVQWF